MGDYYWLAPRAWLCGRLESVTAYTLPRSGGEPVIITHKSKLRY